MAVIEGIFATVETKTGPVVYTGKEWHEHRYDAERHAERLRAETIREHQISIGRLKRLNFK